MTLCGEHTRALNFFLFFFWIDPFHCPPPGTRISRTAHGGHSSAKRGFRDVGRDLGRDMSSTPRMHAGRSGGGRGSGGGSVSNGALAVSEGFFERRDFLSLEALFLKS